MLQLVMLLGVWGVAQLCLWVWWKRMLGVKSAKELLFKNGKLAHFLGRYTSDKGTQDQKMFAVAVTCMMPVLLDWIIYSTVNRTWSLSTVFHMAVWVFLLFIFSHHVVSIITGDDVYYIQQVRMFAVMASVSMPLVDWGMKFPHGSALLFVADMMIVILNAVQSNTQGTGISTYYHAGSAAVSVIRFFLAANGMLGSPFRAQDPMWLASHGVFMVWVLVRGLGLQTPEAPRCNYSYEGGEHKRPV